jgi:hypothetical protein
MNEGTTIWFPLRAYRGASFPSLQWEASASSTAETACLCSTSRSRATWPGPKIS